jgi:DNA-binding NarL/FixJ family response regulator
MTQTTRLLIVDDHHLVREGLRARLSSVDGFEVVGEASHAFEAMAICQSENIDLVLMDVGMRDINGIDLTQQLLAKHSGLLILMLSMYDNPEYVNRAMQSGARGYVLKDAPSGEIITAIRAIMDGKTFLSEALSGRLFRAQTPRPLLSVREAEVLNYLAKGLANKQIAQTLGLSTRTVETHRHNIKRKLKLEGQAELMKYAVERCRGFES